MVARGGTTSRLAGALAGIALAVSGCTAASPSATSSNAASGSARPSALASAPTPSRTSTPSASSSLQVGFQYSDILQAQVDGLAVRQAPTITSPLVQGYRAGGPALEPIGEVRLTTGDFVSVHLGPLPIGDKVWYLVFPAQDARLHYGFIAWSTSPENAGSSGPGWVAASVGDQGYLTLYRHPEKSEIEQYLPVGLTLAGTGDYDSAPQPRSDLFTFSWAAALDDQQAPCAFSVALVPEDGAEAAVVAVDTSTSDVVLPSSSGAGLEVPWGTSGGTWNSFTVSITSGCNWTVGLHALGHD